MNNNMPKDTSKIPDKTANMSPMMKQYLDIKSQHPDSILFFRLGDFYEMFYNDAVIASEELDLVLTKRASGDNEKAPMCGVPYHSSESYIAKLIKKGYRVAICEQTEEASKSKNLVKREVIRVITPGTVTEDSMLESGQNNYLCSVYVSDNNAGVCFTDVSTGELFLTQLESKQLESDIINEITRFCPKEILLNKKAAEFSELNKVITKRVQSRNEVIDDFIYQDDYSKKVTLEHFKVKDFSQLQLEADSVSAKALCCAISFLIKTQKNNISAINNIQFYSKSQYMSLDASTRANLELVETMRSREKKGSLLWVIDHTRTPMGKRLLRNWVEFPLLSPAKIAWRQNAVAELVDNHQVREELNELLKEIKDLERLLTRILFGSANAKELLALSFTLEKMPQIKKAIKNMSSGMLKDIFNNIFDFSDLCNLIKSAFVDDPPITVKEGGIIRDGFNEEVDRLRYDMSHSQNIISELELREQQRTGVKKLRIKYNRVFGYYIEIPNSAEFEMPEEYVRRQTLVNCERYVTDEVKQLENRILGAQDKLIALEYSIFVDIRKKAAQAGELIKKTANAIANLDAVWSLSVTAYKHDYVCPQLTLDRCIEIKEGRHPVVELLSDLAFVPNDTILDCNENRCAIITGPNMAGKSTYMRQTAIIVLLAQIGSFVPAKSAKIGIVDAIFTRVGASDDLASGQSTFMVEMSEVANILKYATSNSLLIIDEIGRGTSTYDGMAIARAVLEYVADKKKLGAKTLFATHYHQLTVLEELIDGVKNYNIAAKKRGDEIIFLRRIVRGGTDDSYGIEVAKLAGVPNQVVNRAKQILKSLEKDGAKTVIHKTVENSNDQLSFAASASDEIINQLKTMDVNVLTPIEAMQTLFDLSEKVKNL